MKKKNKSLKSSSAWATCTYEVIITFLRKIDTVKYILVTILKYGLCLSTQEH